jgi:hypothetical protein
MYRRTNMLADAARLAMISLVTAGCQGAPAPAAPATNRVASPPAEVAKVIDPDSFIPLDVAIVASPAAVRACMTVPETCYQLEGRARRLLVEPGVVVLRWRDVAIYVAKDEASGATQFFASDGPARFKAAVFHGMVGDLGMRHTQRSDLDLIGKDAGFAIDAPDGFYLECFNCRAPSILSALAAVGAQIVPR